MKLAIDSDYACCHVSDVMNLSEACFAQTTPIILPDFVWIGARLCPFAANVLAPVLF